MQQALKILENPSSLALVVVFALLFFLFLCTAGGALGAKLVGGVNGPGPKSGTLGRGSADAAEVAATGLERAGCTVSPGPRR